MGLGGISIWQLIIILLMFMPSIIVLFSKRVSGWRKFGWFLVASAMWVIGLVLFFLLTKKPDDSVTSNE